MSLPCCCPCVGHKLHAHSQQSQRLCHTAEKVSKHFLEDLGFFSPFPLVCGFGNFSSCKSHVQEGQWEPQARPGMSAPDASLEGANALAGAGGG